MCSFYYYSHCFFLNIVCTSHKGMKYEICTHTKPYLYLQYGSFSKMIPEEYCKVLDENHHFQENLCCQVLEAETMGFRAWVPMLREVPIGGANVALIRTCPEKAYIYIYICGQPPLKRTKKNTVQAQYLPKNICFGFKYFRGGLQ